MVKIPISLKPPAAVVKAAKKGLKFHEEFGRGGTDIGVGRAKELITGHELDPKVIIKMASYFARHEVDKKAEDFGNEENPSNGYIAWLLWGGDAGQEWANKIKQKLNDAEE